MTDTLTTTATDLRLREIAEMAADLFTVPVEQVLTADDFIEDLGADSLLAIELLTQLEKRYGVTIPEDELPNMANLRSTYDIVAERAGW
jgi:acyl carrier protein